MTHPTCKVSDVKLVFPTGTDVNAYRVCRKCGKDNRFETEQQQKGRFVLGTESAPVWKSRMVRVCLACHNRFEFDKFVQFEAVGYHVNPKNGIMYSDPFSEQDHKGAERLVRAFLLPHDLGKCFWFVGERASGFYMTENTLNKTVYFLQTNDKIYHLDRNCHYHPLRRDLSDCEHREVTRLQAMIEGARTCKNCQ